MLIVFYGANEIKVREALSTQLDSLKEANPAIVTVRVEADGYLKGQLANMIGATSLFGESYVYVLDTPTLKDDFWAEVESLASDLASSRQTFILVEDSLLAGPKKILTNHATSITEYKNEAGEVFNPFQLADALLRKDKRALWLLLQEAIKNDLPAEEIIGVLWWQIKTLRLAILTKSATEAGIKDFPYNKAKKAISNFKPGEVEGLALSLLNLYHDGHAGERDIDLALEGWVLRL
jgi:DNA polymerase III delta subunit